MTCPQPLASSRKLSAEMRRCRTGPGSRAGGPVGTHRSRRVFTAVADATVKYQSADRPVDMEPVSRGVQRTCLPRPEALDSADVYDVAGGDVPEIRSHRDDEPAL